MKIQSKLWRRVKDGDNLINFHTKDNKRTRKTAQAHEQGAPIMNRIPKYRVRQARRACVAILLALCCAFQRTTNGSSAANQTRPGAADLILHHGFIWTVDESKPQAEAVAVRGDRR